jgi:hypothetical protein
MGETTVCDVLGEPGSWVNCISDEMTGSPDMQGATVVDVFVSRNEVTLYARGLNGTESATVFVIQNQDLRQRIVTAMHPGMDVQAVLRVAV